MNHVQLEDGNLLFWLSNPEEKTELMQCRAKGGYADHRWLVDGYVIFQRIPEAS